MNVIESCKRMDAVTWLILMQALYFLLEFCFYYPNRFFIKYVTERHSMGDSIRELMTPLPWVRFVSSVYWTALADHSQRPTLILLVSVTVCSASFCMLWAGEWWFKDASQSARHVFVATCLLLIHLFLSAVYPLLGDRFMALLPQQPTPSSSNTLSQRQRQRLWYQIGSLVAIGVFETTVQNFGFPGMLLSVLLSAALLVICSANLQPKHFGGPSKGSDADARAAVLPHDRQHVYDELDKATPGTLPKRPFVQFVMQSRFLVLSLMVLIGEVARVAALVYLPRHLYKWYWPHLTFTAALGALQGLTMVSAFLTSQVLVRFCGPETVLVLGTFFGMLRTGCYGFMPSSGEWARSVPYVELLAIVSNTFLIVGGVGIVYALDNCKETDAAGHGPHSGMRIPLPLHLLGLLLGIVSKYCEEDGDGFSMATLLRLPTLVPLLSVLPCALFVISREKK